MIDLRTAKQIELAERNKRIVEDYTTIKAQPGATPNRVYCTLAKMHNMTQSGILHVLKKEGCLQKH